MSALAVSLVAVSMLLMNYNSMENMKSVKTLVEINQQTEHIAGMMKEENERKWNQLLKR